MSREVLETITAIDARDLSIEAEGWLTENDISTHYQNDIVQVEDDGNAFAEWLKEQGYVFKYPTDKKCNQFDSIGIFAT